MDPDACLNGCRDLLDWYGRGGFAPLVGWDQLAPLLNATWDWAAEQPDLPEPRQDPRQ